MVTYIKPGEDGYFSYNTDSEVRGKCNKKKLNYYEFLALSNIQVPQRSGKRLSKAPFYTAHLDEQGREIVRRIWHVQLPYALRKSYKPKYPNEKYAAYIASIDQNGKEYNIRPLYFDRQSIMKPTFGNTQHAVILHDDLWRPKPKKKARPHYKYEIQEDRGYEASDSSGNEDVDASVKQNNKIIKVKKDTKSADIKFECGKSGQSNGDGIRLSSEYENFEDKKNSELEEEDDQNNGDEIVSHIGWDGGDPHIEKDSELKEEDGHISLTFEGNEYPRIAKDGALKTLNCESEGTKKTDGISMDDKSTSKECRKIKGKETKHQKYTEKTYAQLKCRNKGCEGNHDLNCKEEQNKTRAIQNLHQTEASQRKGKANENTKNLTRGMKTSATCNPNGNKMLNVSMDLTSLKHEGESKTMKSLTNSYSNSSGIYSDIQSEKQDYKQTKERVKPRDTKTLEIYMQSESEQEYDYGNAKSFRSEYEGDNENSFGISFDIKKCDSMKSGDKKISGTYHVAKQDPIDNSSVFEYDAGKSMQKDIFCDSKVTRALPKSQSKPNDLQMPHRHAKSSRIYSNSKCKDKKVNQNEVTKRNRIKSVSEYEYESGESMKEEILNDTQASKAFSETKFKCYNVKKAFGHKKSSRIINNSECDGKKVYQDEAEQFPIGISSEYYKCVSSKSMKKQKLYDAGACNDNGSNIVDKENYGNIRNSHR